MLTEKEIENKIRRFLTEQGAYHIKHFGCMFSKAGVPDLIACLNGLFIAIEVKSEKGKLSELQEDHIKQIREAGGISMMVRSVDEVVYYLTSMGVKLLPPKNKSRRGKNDRNTKSIPQLNLEKEGNNNE